MKATGREWLVTIQRYGVASDEWNQPVEGWSDLCQVYAEKLDISDGERVRAAQVGSTVTTRFRTLWSEQIADLNPKDRLFLDGRYFEIIGVKEIGRRAGIEITTTVQSDGPAQIMVPPAEPEL